MKTPSKPKTGSEPGRLLVVATPLGNLSDLSPRAAETLARADIIAAEDTRRTRGLLSHLGLKGRLVSCREHNEARAAAGLINEILAGAQAALVTDAGTPALSDPGWRVVAAAHRAGIKVEAVPGPAALAAALSVSGLPSDRFTFGGFPPAKKAARVKFFRALAGREETLVFYEAPHRLAASLADMAAVFGPRPVVLCRELTKLHEEIRRTDLDELAAWALEVRVRGEVTLVVAGAEAGEEEFDSEAFAEQWRLLRAEGFSASRAAKELAGRLPLARAEAYRLGLELEKKAGGEKRLED